MQHTTNIKYAVIIQLYMSAAADNEYKYGIFFQSSSVYISMAASSKLCAVFLTYPYQVIRARLQVCFFFKSIFIVIIFMCVMF